jgi:plastocyanin
MRRLLALLLALVVLAVVAAGCGGGDDDDGDSGNGGGNAPAAEEPAAEEPAAPTAEDGGGGSGGTGPGTQVSMKDIKFNPGTVTIKAGGKVTWTNDDSVGHDVTADDFESGSPGGIDGGSTFSHTFKKAGTYNYVCSVHPGMEGTVKVTKG